MARPSDNDGGDESSRDRDGSARLARLGEHVAEVSPVADEFRGKDSDARRASAAVRKAMRNEESARRSGKAAEIAKAQESVSNAKNALTTARLAAADARTRLERVRDAVLRIPRPEDAVGTLSAEYPVALLPIRIETRFVGKAHSRRLLVRVYPDDVHVETHEPELTPDELADATAIVNDFPGLSIDERRRRWVDLADRHGAQRAAYIRRRVADGETQAEKLDTWTRAPAARTFPDRWVVIGYGGDRELVRQWSAPIADSLALGPDPDAAPPADGVAIDPAWRWLTDFEEAKTAGMAIDVALPAEAMGGLDRLLVLGVKPTLTPQDAATRIEALLEGHHYTEGMSILRPGTPSNNTGTVRSGHRTSDTGHERSYSVEVEGVDVPAGGAGAELATALGLDASVFRNIEGANRAHLRGTLEMNTALWSVSWGYFLTQMVGHDPDHDVVQKSRSRFREWVRARGPVAALRIGVQPYGVLPVTLIDAAAAGAAPDPVLDMVHTVRPAWEQAIPHVPRLNRTSDAAADLAEILSMDATTADIRNREVFGSRYVDALAGLTGRDAQNAFWKLHATKVGTSLSKLDFAGMAAGARRSAPPLFQNVFAGTATPVGWGLVAQEPLSDTKLAEYIESIRTASLDKLRRQVGDGRVPPVALAVLLRHARLLEGADAARVLLASAGSAPPPFRDSEFVGIGAGPGEPTVAASLSATMPGAGPRKTAAEVLSERMQSAHGAVPPRMQEFQSALETLASIPTRELELLFTETIDLCSHRFDAWVTSYATERLAGMRKKRPKGVHIGAFGWLENVWPRDAARPKTQGWIHAPSLDQAAAAGILRGAQLARRSVDGQPLALDLGSRRVRQANYLLDGVRQGQSLGALLGYRLERRLKAEELADFIDWLRRLAPLTTGRVRNETTPQESIAENTVIDGLRLIRIWRDVGRTVQGLVLHADAASAIPRRSVADARLPALLDDLEAAFDAVGDANLAESVFQVVKGNTDRAGAVLDAMAKGEAPPPELEFMRTPRPGVALTHRVLVLLRDDGVAPAAGSTRVTPRSAAAPLLDRWCASLLGDQRPVLCRARIHPPAPAAPIPTDVYLGDLGLSALDVVELSGVQEEAARTELEGRIADRLVRAGQVPHADSTIELDIHHRDPGDPRALSFAEYLEMARAIHDLLGRARALAPSDLQLPYEPSPAAPVIDVAAAASLADAAVASLRKALTDAAGAGGLREARMAVLAPPAGQLPALLAVLRQKLEAMTAFGIRRAMPVRPIDVDRLPIADPQAQQERLARLTIDLARQAESVEREVEQRLDRLQRAGPTPNDPAAAVAFHLSDRLRIVFGQGFLSPPGFVPGNGGELDAAFAHAALLVGGEVGVAEAFLTRSARVRKPLSELQKVATYAHALGRATAPFELIQLPHDDANAWAGRPAGASPLRGGTVSFLVSKPFGFAGDRASCGLMVDAWDEVLPDAEQTTGVAFHFDQPDQETPQSILLAVPPQTKGPWTLETLAAIVNEALDLAKMRVVDLETLEFLGHVLPAMYVAQNEKGDTLSVDFAKISKGAARGKKV